MALITDLIETRKDRQTVHGSVQCVYSTFLGSDGRMYLQLDTLGSTERKTPGKTNQTMQFNESSAARLKELIEKTFPSLR